MSRFDPATRIVVAVLAGLAAAGLGRPLLSAGALALGAEGAPVRVLAVAAAAGLWWGEERAEPLRRRTLEPGPFSGRVVVTGRPSGRRAIARAVVAREDVVLEAPVGLDVVQGGRYRSRGRLALPDPDVRGYYASQGAHLELDARTLVLEGRRGGFWGAVDRLHGAALRRLGAAREPTPQRALVAGVTLGESGSLPYEQRRELRASGLWHLVAASGQNVALVVGLTLLVLGLAGVMGVPARVTALGVVAAYVLLAGGGPSIVRAGVSGTLASTAWLLSRPALRWHLAAWGAVVVLAVNPLEVYDPGFQLSFAAVAAIFLVAPRLAGLVGQAAAVSIACTIVTAPIAYVHFGRAPVLAVPANLLALPAVAPILWLGLAAIVLGALAPPLGALLLAPADALASYLLWVASMFS